jgi:hypothetical protein
MELAAEAVEKGLVFGSQKLYDEICNKIATGTLPLKALCAENPHWPRPELILEWRMRDPKFAAAYHAAKGHQIEALVDEMLEISDNVGNDNITKYDKEGDAYSVPNNEWINRSRLKIATRQWLASKLLPRVYGDKTQTDTTITVKHEDAIRELL